MKFYYVASLLLGASLFANAQGYKDGIEYYKAGQFDNAITILTKNMNSADTDKALANYYLGQAYLNKGDKAKAKTYFDAGVAADPNCAYNYVGLGAIYLLEKNKSAAEDNFKKAQSLGKKNSEITVDIARAYYNADPVTYAKEIDKYIEKARKDSKSKEPAIYIFEGDRKTNERNFNEAATWYEQAINFDSDNPEGYVKYAKTYFYVAPDFAIKKLEELLAKQPNSALAQRELAEKYYENHQWGKASRLYSTYMQNPNHFPQDKARFVVLLFADKNYDEAVATAREVLAENPNDLTVKRIAYRSLAEGNHPEEAIVEAAEFFNNPEFKGRFNGSDYIIYAQLLSNADRLPEAEQVLKKGVAALPEDATVARSLADLLAKENKNGEAFEAYVQYMKALEEPTTKDYNTGSLFALNAVSETKDDENLRNSYAATGLEYLDKISDPANPSAGNLLRKVQILLNRNLGVVDADSEAAILELMAVLDKDPENANPANSANNLNVYRILYNQLVSYYDRTDNKEAADAARAKLQMYNDLLNQ